jgi:hypothetical protein
MTADGWGDDQRVILECLARETERDGVKWRGSFEAARDDARGATGRDRTTGAVVDHDRGASWLGAVGYLVLLDTIGSALRPVDSPVVGEFGIRAALRHFAPEVDADEREAIYALRCSLAHSYGLIYRRKHTYVFTLVYFPNGDLIRLPEARWNGDLSAIGPEHRTYVNLWALGDLAERVAQTVESLANAGELAIVIPDGAAELRAQFVFAVYP